MQVKKIFCYTFIQILHKLILSEAASLVYKGILIRTIPVIILQEDTAYLYMEYIRGIFNLIDIRNKSGF